ncbi:hypothetical protein AA103196_1391 [Ameyamaea chiangmaiensis NBRC 103196]|uniref:UPF0260 protein HUK82_15230 n=1 Tax=Ameyamaea chiangmaiensis TaxID=442969 RepID=A0A850PHL6_9PROT|nr:YcgN family cysteine cluster protein [Ameyamaea chiangmaiensis]MBS4075213.1 YcgN family cysteine cluster protein [Ameyamaea chiangmaiensis]NVN41900.1 YcgN family cysteine cluster protein [Ameyamaea chiangmaiensis]GBQ66422.1 hypothetical protein AA103196_1391 [Ameyamaea chiangmaiensis NBRC 103196]
MPVTKPFWTTKSLAEMSAAEWESLCDGCGRCCLHKLRDDDTDEILFSEVACRLLDVATCRCRDYPRRQAKVPDCISLTPAMLETIDWLPPTCAYRRLQEGRDLPWWHPLVSGRAETVREAGISAAGRIISERHAGAVEDHLVDWPGEDPTRGPTVPGR